METQEAGAAKLKRNKYKAVRKTVDGITFHSTKEANRYCELKVLLQAGAISNLELQPVFPIMINGVKVCEYRADFRYTQGFHQITEDVKGVRTEVYRLKKKLVEASYPGVLITEVLTVRNRLSK